MKQNKVQDVQRRLAEKGLKVSESAIVDASMDLVLNTEAGVVSLELLFKLRASEREYEKYLKNKELGRRDNV